MGIFSDMYKGKIGKKRDEIKKIDADIEKFRKGIEDAKKARDLFEQTKKDMDQLVEDTTLYFKGSSAPKFKMRLLDYGSFCNGRADDMRKTIKNLKKRITKFEEDKGKFQDDINKYQSVLNVLQFLHI